MCVWCSLLKLLTRHGVPQRASHGVGAQAGSKHEAQEKIQHSTRGVAGCNVPVGWRPRTAMRARHPTADCWPTRAGIPPRPDCPGLRALRAYTWLLPGESMLLPCRTPTPAHRSSCGLDTPVYPWHAPPPGLMTGGARGAFQLINPRKRTHSSTQGAGAAGLGVGVGTRPRFWEARIPLPLTKVRVSEDYVSGRGSQGSA